MYVVWLNINITFSESLSVGFITWQYPGIPSIDVLKYWFITCIPEIIGLHIVSARSGRTESWWVVKYSI